MTYNSYGYDYRQRTYEAQRAYEAQQNRIAAQRVEAARRAVAASRIAQIETAMNQLGNYIEQKSKRAAEAAWQARWDAHKARVAAATPAPAPSPSDREPTREEIKRAARAPREPYISSVIDPLVSSPGSNIRSR
jgi:hypothetical protein